LPVTKRTGEQITDRDRNTYKRRFMRDLRPCIQSHPSEWATRMKAQTRRLKGFCETLTKAPSIRTDIRSTRGADDTTVRRTPIRRAVRLEE
jgi:hypothetical protein